MAYPDIGRGYRQNRRRKAAEKEEVVKKPKKATPKLNSPGARARAMSAAVGLDTSTDTSTDSPPRGKARAPFGTERGGRAMRLRDMKARKASARNKYKAPKPKAKAKAKPVKKVNDLSRMSETKVVGTRRPNQSQELKAKKSAITTPRPAPKPPKIDLNGKTKTKPADMMRRKSATGRSMVAEKNPKTVGAAKKAGKSTFIGKDGRKKAAVTREELKASGLSLRDYLNKQQGKTRRKAKK